MRHQYWNDAISTTVQQEKQYLRQLLIDQHIFPDASLDDAQYLFFSLPSAIILKGYAQGFCNNLVHGMICQYIQTNQQQLKQRSPLKIQF